MSVSEDERTGFHETGEIHDFCDWITTVEGTFLSRNGLRFFSVALSAAEFL